MTELGVILEHWERYRSVTLQFLETLTDEELHWRPDAGAYSCGQQLLHIAQTEDYYERGFSRGEWDQRLLGFPRELPLKEELRAFFAVVRERMNGYLRALAPADLDRPLPVPHAPPGLPLRWWLWFVLEHEIHHKAQLSVYFRQMGKVAPYYAFPFPAGERPDLAVREALGGV